MKRRSQAVDSPAKSSKPSSRTTSASPKKAAKPNLMCKVCGLKLTSEKEHTQHEFFHTVDKNKIIRMKLEDVEDFDKDGEQKTLEKIQIIDGVTWALEVSRHEGYLHVQVACHRNKQCAIWECEVEGEAKLISKKKDSRSIYKTFAEVLSNAKIYGLVQLLEWDNLIGSEYVVNGDIEIEARIVVKCMRGGRVRAPFDFSTPVDYSDAVLLVGNERFHVSKAILANVSTHFYDIFYKNSFKKTEVGAEIELKDVDAEIFRTALMLIYDSVNNVDENNMEPLLKLAESFKIPKILNIVDRWMYVNECCPLHNELLLTDKYGLEVAKAQKLRYSIPTSDVAKEVKESESYEKYSADLKAKIDKKIEALAFMNK